MWKYSELNAYDSISLHDCRTDDIKIDGNDLVVYFPDGFWITPVSKHIDHHRPLKTGPSQLRFIGLGTDSVIDSVDLYKSIRLFQKTILCKRIQPEVADFLKLISDGKHELEFLYEFHNSYSALYKCWLWKKNRKMEAECQLELTAKNIEYCWNEICKDREW
ncbi:MAG: hypothetical protein IJY91_00980 [Oscillospiraceae bacterium]|nr:hypothetical protein [Oscillospiraceae bacterium]